MTRSGYPKIAGGLKHSYVILTWIFMSFFTLYLFVIAALNIASTGVSLDLPIFVVLIGAVPLAMLVDHGFVESFLGLGENCFETG
jgi:hypothetical protein